MKIARLTESIQSLSRVREKSDGGQSQNQNPHHDRPKQDSQKPKDQNLSGDFAHDLAKVTQAVDSFAHEAQAQAHGLQAAVEGTGPGLQVVLKDGSGAVVRQFTGEEFLKLRETASNAGGSRGKLLDRKL